MKDELTITLSLSDFIDTHLARSTDHREEMWHSREIESHLVEKILAITNNESHCYIELVDEYSNHLAKPKLWDWKAWQVECDRRIRAQKIAEVARIQRYIFKANVILVTQALEDMSFDREAAIQSATKLVTRANEKAIKAIGVDSLFTDVKEIPAWMEKML